MTTTDDFARQITRINESDLSDAAKAAAIQITIREINGAAWQPSAAARARELGAMAQAALDALPMNLDTLDGMNELSERGMLRPTS